MTPMDKSRPKPKSMSRRNDGNDPGQKASRKGRQHHDHANKGDPGSQASERQADRENQTGRGSGEGVSGLQRGDGHPTGR